MSATELMSHYFKPEVRNAGSQLFDKGEVTLSISGDTQIQAYVKRSGSSRVKFMSESIGNPLFTADCNCTSASKGQLCKHIWATLLAVEQKNPDFLDSKTDIEKFSTAKAPPSAYEIRQTEYKKQMQEQQKLRAKAQRDALKETRKTAKNADRQTLRQPSVPAVSDESEEVTEAMLYFEEHGVELQGNLTEESLRAGRKQIARVFHPDRGGTHEDGVELNKYFDILLGHLLG